MQIRASILLVSVLAVAVLSFPTGNEVTNNEIDERLKDQMKQAVDHLKEWMILNNKTEEDMMLMGTPTANLTEQMSPNDTEKKWFWWCYWWWLG